MNSNVLKKVSKNNVLRKASRPGDRCVSCRVRLPRLRWRNGDWVCKNCLRDGMYKPSSV